MGHPHPALPPLHQSGAPTHLSVTFVKYGSHSWSRNAMHFASSSAHGRRGRAPRQRFLRGGGGGAAVALAASLPAAAQTSIHEVARSSNSTRDRRRLPQRDIRRLRQGLAPRAVRDQSCCYLVKRRAECASPASNGKGPLEQNGVLAEERDFKGDAARQGLVKGRADNKFSERIRRMVLLPALLPRRCASQPRRPVMQPDSVCQGLQAKWIRL